MARALIITSEFVTTGPNNVILNYIRRMAPHYEITVIALRYNNAKTDNYADMLKTCGAANVIQWRNFGILKAIRHALISKYALINTHGWRADITFSILAPLLPFSRLIATIHNIPFEDYRQRYGSLLGGQMHFLHNKLCFGNERVLKLCVSGNVKNELDKRKAKNTHIAYNFVDATRFAPLESYVERGDQRDKLGIPSQSKVFIYCGALIPLKDPLTLVRAIRRFRNSTAFFIFVGDGPLLPAIKMELRNSDNVLFTGRVANPEAYIKCSDFYVSTSSTEGMPMALLEAMSCNLRAICTNIPIHNEIKMLDAFDIDTFPTGDDEALAKLIATHALESEKESMNRLLTERHFSGHLLLEKLAGH